MSADQAAPREATVADLEARVIDLTARLDRMERIFCDVLEGAISDRQRIASLEEAAVLVLTGTTGNAARPAHRTRRRHLQAVPAGPEASA